jgi:hypothetical protein
MIDRRALGIDQVRLLIIGAVIIILYLLTIVLVIVLHTEHTFIKENLTPVLHVVTNVISGLLGMVGGSHIANNRKEDSDGPGK